MIGWKNGLMKKLELERYLLRLAWLNGRMEGRKKDVWIDGMMDRWTTEWI